jgi:hypothetical protein
VIAQLYVCKERKRPSSEQVAAFSTAVRLRKEFVTNGVPTGDFAAMRTRSRERYVMNWTHVQGYKLIPEAVVTTLKANRAESKPLAKPSRHNGRQPLQNFPFVI